MKYKAGKLFIYTGVLFLMAALGLCVYNLWDAKRAEKLSAEILTDVAVLQEENPLAGDMEYVELTQTDFLLAHPEITMPTMDIDGTAYIGVLEIPSLKLKLPVASQWNYDRLRRSPCRYTGSVYSRDIVIAGHNYAKHFSPIKTLKSGDSVLFTDADGNVFPYEVAGTDVIEGTDLEGMQAGEWDLTLFTCTSDRRSRWAVRCKLKNVA